MTFKPKLNAEQKEFLEKFKKAGARFFFKKMTRSMVTRVIPGKYGYQMEFPIEFLNKHKFEWERWSSFVCKSRDAQSTQVWPFKTTVRMMGRKVRVFAYGNDGWKQFVADNYVQVGDSCCDTTNSGSISGVKISLGTASGIVKSPSCKLHCKPHT